MYLVYYFLRNKETNEKRETVFSTIIGEIGEEIFFDNKKYIIEDFAEEYFDLEEPEDY